MGGLTSKPKILAQHKTLTRCYEMLQELADTGNPVILVKIDKNYYMASGQYFTDAPEICGSLERLHKVAVLDWRKR